jgi:Family of unknown function (DUF6152)
MRTALSIALALSFGVFLSPLTAHHGWAAFEAVKKVTLTGTVTEFHFVNPHSVVEFEVKDAQGKVVTWEGELTSPSHLIPKGWSASSLDFGDVVTITGFPAKNGSHFLRITKLMLANGKELKMGTID